MITAVDTNIFSVLWAGVEDSRKLESQLDHARRTGSLVICPVVYAESLANPKMNEEQVISFLRDTGIIVEFEMGEAIWVQAGHRYAAYAGRRRASGECEPKRMLADILIGAHALIQADRLMTLDQGRYRRDFPDLQLI